MTNLTAPLGALDLFGSATWVSNWLTPLWVIGIGALLGLMVLLVLWGVVFALRKLPVFNRLAEVPLTISEGPLAWVLGVAAALAAFGVIGVVVVPRPAEMVTALARWPQLGTTTYEFEIPAPPHDDLDKKFEVEVPFRRSELREMRLLAWRAGEGEATHLVIYKGPFARVTDDAGTVYTRGARAAVTPAQLEARQRGPAAGHFAVLPEGGGCCGAGE